MNTQQLKKFNHYLDFKTENGIDNIINFINDGILPDGLTARQRTGYNKKFGDESGFQVRDNKLYYNPNENINLEVIKPINRVEKIQEIYDDIRRGLGVGLGSFYHQITLSYLNIPKQMTDSFLKKQGDYIVGRVPHKLVNKPITSKVCNERWGIDLIDMEAYYNPTVNGQNKYILTAVDYFSGRVFARPLLNRNNNNAHPTLSNALNDICVNCSRISRAPSPKSI